MATDWTQQLGQMTQAWSKTQQSLWENWYEMASNGFSAGNTATNWDVSNATNGFKASQETIARLVEFVNQAWKNISEQVQKGADWQTTMDNFMAQVRAQMNIPSEWSQSSQDATKLWDLYVKQWQQFGQPWAGMMMQGPRSFNNRGAAVVEWSQLYWDTYDRTVGRLIDAPGVGLPRELNHKLSEGFVAWQKMQQATSEYQTLMVDTTVKAFEAFTKKLAEKAQQGQPVHTLQEFVDLWTDTADNVFVESFETSEYIAAQWNLLNSNTAFRLHQQEITDMLLQLNNMPTRSEVDEAHKNIYEHGRAIKALQKSAKQASPVAPAHDNGAEVAELKKMVAELRQEIETLKTAVATPPQPKPATRRRTTKKEDTTEKAPEGGES